MRLSPFLIMAAAALLLGGCATEYKNKQAMLKASGFRTFAVTQPAQAALFKVLPPDKISAVTNHRRTYYVFPDPEIDRVYAGTKNEFRAYEKLRAKRKLPTEKFDAASLSTSPDWNGWQGLSDGWYTF